MSTPLTSGAWAHELSVARQAACDAAELIRGRFGQKNDVQYKTPIEPLTEADLIADQLLEARIRDAFPDDAWMSEEGGDSSRRLFQDRVWIVDPLDGTREFIEGRPEFCVSIALVERGAPVVGVVVNPLTGEVFTARQGQGAHRNDAPLRVSDASVPQKADIVVSRNESRSGMLSAFEGRLPLRPLGGMANKLAVIAAGLADGTFTCQQRCQWDVAAGMLLVTEAGGRVTRLDGRPLLLNQPSPTFEGLLATNGPLHDRLLAVVRDLVAP